MQKDDSEGTSRVTELIGKAEMNFAEFPLGFLSERVPKGCDSFVVEDRVRFRGEIIPRRLSVLPAKGYGFPVAKDREIITACVQVTKKAGFPEDGKVHFSRYEVIDTLQWEHGGGQYKRLKHGLEKLTFTGYKWENSWWDNEAKQFCDHSFSILDNVVCAPNDRRRRQDGKTPPRTSWFKWNEVVVASFKAGFLKDLNMDIYRSLGSLLAKEMFSLLDKNFYWKKQLDYKLVEFAFHKLGMRGKSYEDNVAKIKDSLKEPIEELVSWGIIRENSNRFFRDNYGEWHVLFEKGKGGSKRRVENVHTTSRSHAPNTSVEDRKRIIRSLTKRGLSADFAMLCSLEHSLKALQKAVKAMDEQRTQGKQIQYPDKWFAAALDRGFESTGQFQKSNRRPERRIFRAGSFR